MVERKEFLTATEVMERLRLGRTTVYQQARLFLITGGAEGIPCRRYGRSLRFPAAELDAMVSEPCVVPPPRAKVVDHTDARERTPVPASEPGSRSTRRHRRTTRPRTRRPAHAPTLELTDPDVPTPGLRSEPDEGR